MRKWLNGAVVDFDDADIAQYNAAKLSGVNSTREGKKAFFRETAGDGIKAILGTTKTGEALLIHQQNLATAASQLHRKETKGTATVAEIARLDALDAARDVIEAWRDAENAASLLLDSAGIDTNDTVAERLAEIDAVTPTWPS